MLLILNRLRQSCGGLKLLLPPRETNLALLQINGRYVTYLQHSQMLIRHSLWYCELKVKVNLVISFLFLLHSTSSDALTVLGYRTSAYHPIGMTRWLRNYMELQCLSKSFMYNKIK